MDKPVDPLILMNAEQGENTPVLKQGGETRVIPLKKVTPFEPSNEPRNWVDEQGFYDGIWHQYDGRMDPCPWCGGKVSIGRQYDRWAAFECDAPESAECHGGNVGYFPPEEFEEQIKRWNTRTSQPDADVNDLVEALEDILECLHPTDHNGVNKIREGQGINFGKAVAHARAALAAKSDTIARGE